MSLPRPLWLALVFILAFPLSLSAASQVEFLASLKTLQDEGAGNGRLVLELTPDFEVSVRVTELTEIRDGRRRLALSDLVPGMLLDIEGIFTSTEILAEDVVVSQGVAEIEVQGRVSAVDLGRRTLTVAGLTLSVPEGAIRDSRDGTRSLADLQPGSRVRAEGNFTGAGWTASSVTPEGDSEEATHLTFEGIVTAIRPESSTLEVLLEGVGPVLVRISEDTEIHGDLSVGVLVRVIGTLDPDLFTRARKILVKTLLQLAPPHLKMKTEQERRVEVVLRNPLEQEVELEIRSLDPSLAEPSLDRLVIPAGKTTGFFQIVSGAGTGETAVEVSLPADLGGLKLTLPVEIAKKGEGEETDGEEDQDRKLKLHWVPGQLNLKTNQAAGVQLQLNRPAPEELAVLLAVTEGNPSLLRFFPAQVVLAKGSRQAEVEVEAGDLPGEVKLEARLPDGEERALRIRIRLGDSPGLQLHWSPDRIEAGPGQTLTATLQLSAPAPSEIRVSLNPEGEARRRIKFPSHVFFPEGATQAVVELETKRVAGTARIRASLPFLMGGSSDLLEVRITE